MARRHVGDDHGDAIFAPGVTLSSPHRAHDVYGASSATSITAIAPAESAGAVTVSGGAMPGGTPKIATYTYRLRPPTVTW